MKQRLSVILFVALVVGLSGSLAAATIHVSQAKGDNNNPGTAAGPLREIDRAITMAAAGDEIRIAGGTYTGTFGIGCMESDKPLQIVGSFDEGFSRQDVVRTPTVFRPDNASGGKARKAFLKFTRAVDGTVVDGIVFDMGLRNAFSDKEGLIDGLETGRLLRSTERPAVGNSTVEEPIIQFVSATAGGDVTIRNCVFLNGASFGLQAGHRSGTFRVLNNVFVANRMAAIEIYGTCAAKGGPNAKTMCGEVEIAHNTILFTWSRLKDFGDMGYGVRVMSKCRYAIHHNIIGGSVLAGIDHTRFNPDEWLSVDDNIFFVNKQGDIEYSPASNTKLNIPVAQFGDLRLASVKNNRNEIPRGMPVSKIYLNAFLAARYSEQVDFNPDSPANQWRAIMGLNKQGKIASQVTMFMNRYPLADALKLFGAVKTAGAQLP